MLTSKPKESPQDAPHDATFSASSPLSDMAHPTSDQNHLEINTHNDNDIKDNLEKLREFNNDFNDDYYLDASKFPVLRSVSTKISSVKEHVGHGNFNLISFDDLLKIVRHIHKSPFTKTELEFIEEIFFADGKRYGFFGKKVKSQLTAVIAPNTVIKIPYTGHYLYKGEALEVYDRVKKDIGKTLILTSGIRSIVKQFDLFLIKAIDSDGNLSKASRSLAPPGYSYHGIGDFDVGKVGFGAKNFSDQFATTQEFQQLINLGYLSIRYTQDNHYGVRFEPWHIKVVS